jgi:hypothetical protein
MYEPCTFVEFLACHDGENVRPIQVVSTATMRSSATSDNEDTMRYHKEQNRGFLWGFYEPPTYATLQQQDYVE